MSNKNENKNKKGAIIFWGLTRGLKHTINNLQINLFDVLKDHNMDYDIFIHTWYFKGEYNNKWHGLKSIALDFDEYKLLNAKYVMVEDQDKVQQNTDFKQYQTHGDCFNNNFQSFNFYILSLISQQRIISKFEEVKNEYDFVIFQRPDILYKQKFNIEWINSINKNNIIVPTFGGATNNKHRINDRWCICNPENAIKYANVLKHLLEYSKREQVSAEVYLGWIFYDYHKLNVDQVDVIFHRIKPDGSIVNNDKKL